MKKSRVWSIIIIALIVCTHFWVTSKQQKKPQNKEQIEVISLPNLISQEEELKITKSEDFFTKLYQQKKSDVQVTGEGVVIKILADDNEGSRHQKFILGLDEGMTLLISHNIDLAPRIENLTKGDVVKFNGEYVWNDKGGLIHWTHKDPQAQHLAGYLQHKGKIYQ